MSQIPSTNTANRYNISPSSQQKLEQLQSFTASAQFPIMKAAKFKTFVPKAPSMNTANIYDLVQYLADASRLFNIGPDSQNEILQYRPRIRKKNFAETSEEGIGAISERKRFVRFSSHKRRETQQITFSLFFVFFLFGTRQFRERYLLPHLGVYHRHLIV